MNTFGISLRLTTYGESHGIAIGGVLDGMPPNLAIDFEKIQALIQKRKGGKNAYVTPRSEEDKVEFLSGIFEGKTTGSPIAFIIHNHNTQSKDYQRDILRPSHADFTYFHKYKHYDYRGGGRSSARETLVRVVASGLVSPILQEIEIQSGVYSIGEIKAREINFSYAQKSEIFSLDPQVEDSQKALIQKMRSQGDSIGGVVWAKARGPKLLGLGEPIYGKLDAKLAEAMMGINGVKAVEIGEGIQASYMKGSEYNDCITPQGFGSNHSGGILGGIGNGDDILIKVYFKPTASISLPQNSITTSNKAITLQIKGRHDPCIAIRGSVVVEAMMRLVIADMILLSKKDFC